MVINFLDQIGEIVLPSFVTLAFLANPKWRTAAVLKIKNRDTCISKTV